MQSSLFSSLASEGGEDLWNWGTYTHPYPTIAPAGPSVLSALNTARPAVCFIPDGNEEQMTHSRIPFYFP